MWYSAHDWCIGDLYDLESSLDLTAAFVTHHDSGCNPDRNFCAEGNQNLRGFVLT